MVACCGSEGRRGRVWDNWGEGAVVVEEEEAGLGGLVDWYYGCGEEVGVWRWRREGRRRRGRRHGVGKKGGNDLCFVRVERRRWET